ncbi:MAG: N-acetylmuramoyl-L-alanine amidase [Micromonosporaceae bacterium]|nr:N-acetylmuramoyl-L-alanine amidase [Micromonosporaceae bacterium]
MLVIGRGDAGPAVIEIRAILRTLSLLDADDGSDTFDARVEQAVRAFQQARGLTVTGDVTEETWRALDAARWTLGARVLAHEQPEPLFGDDVRQLQERLLELGYDLGRADGIFGRRTAAALATFQREVGLVADGVCGPATVAALRRLGRKVVGGRPTLLRETVRLHASGPALAGRRIVLDPGHGGDDPGISVAEAGQRWTEADLAYDLAARLAEQLTALGVRVYLTRGIRPTGPLTEANRASLANELGAELVLSLHLDGHPSPYASGVATYHYGYAAGSDGGVTSTLGERLAELVQDEIVNRTGLRDCRTHAKTWDLLRLTRMPAVRVEFGYLTSPDDRTLLIEPTFRDTVAAAITTAVQRLYAPAELEAPVGAVAGESTLVTV